MKKQRDRLILKKTDFNLGKTTTWREVVYAIHRGPSRSWELAMYLLRKANRENEGNNVFFWLKYT